MDENRYGSTGGTGDGEEKKVTLDKPVNLEVQNVPPTRDAYGNSYRAGQTGSYGQGGAGYGNNGGSYGQGGGGYGNNGGSYGQGGAGYGQGGSGYGTNGGGYGQNTGNYGQFGSNYGQFGGGSYGSNGGNYGQNAGSYGQFGGGGYGQNNGYGYRGGQNDKRDADNGFGIAAMILGIISLLLFCTCLNWVTGVLAIIFAIIQLAKGGQRAYPIVGIITAGVSFLLCIVTYLFFSFSAINDPSYKSYPYYYNSYDTYDGYSDADLYGDENDDRGELPEGKGIKSL